MLLQMRQVMSHTHVGYDTYRTKLLKSGRGLRKAHNGRGGCNTVSGCNNQSVITPIFKTIPYSLPTDWIKDYRLENKDLSHKVARENVHFNPIISAHGVHQARLKSKR